MQEQGAGAPAGEGATLVARVRAQAERRGQHLALVGPAGSWTFAELDERSDRAAAAMVASWGGGAEPIALLFDHDAPLVVALVAVMKAGRPFVVLDPAAPPEVNAAVLGDSTAVAVVHDHPREGDAALGDVVWVGWDDLDADPVGLDDGSPDDLALLAYTSGTTGAPKAAMVSHRALVHLMDGATEALGITEDEHMPMLFPLSLAVAAYPMFLPLVNGATLHTFDMRSLGLAPFPDWLADEGITLLYFSPTVARFLQGAMGERPLDRLRTVVLGGERVDDDAVAVVREVFGQGVEVFNGYGTTETGVLTFHRVAPDEVNGPAGVPAGVPIPGMDLILVDDRGEPVAPGEVGELVVRSPYLFSGYWRRPDADASVLSTDPETGLPVYRTGDLGRWREGELELLGRSDSEVKVRGHRVVPGEVEQAALSLAEVVDAVVDARPDLMGANELVAWVVPAPGIGVEEVRSALASVVKAHLVPSTILLLDALPVLPNGKLDRRALPDPPTGRPDGLGPYAPAQDPDELAVLDAWEQVFSIRPIGVHDDFEALGGQSLDAARLLIVLESRHGIRLPMSDLIEARTIAEMAERVRADRLATQLGRRNAITVVTPPTGDRPTLYFVHDLHGTAYSLRHLAPLLGPDQPLAGFESPFLDGNRAPFSSLETLALRYLSDLRRHQPEGPYLLAGYSFGGVLAFEMARQLVAAGESVPFLGVFDVGPGYRGRHYHPKRPPQKPTLQIPMPPAEAPLREEARWYAEQARRSPVGLVDHLLVRSRLDRATDRLREERDLRRRGSIHPARRLWYAWRTHWTLASRYDWAGRTYPGPLTLFWADETASTDATMGWGAIVEDGLEIVRVPIEHEAFLQEQGVTGIAPALRAALDRTLAHPGATP